MTRQDILKKFDQNSDSVIEDVIKKDSKYLKRRVKSLTEKIEDEEDAIQMYLKDKSVSIDSTFIAMVERVEKLKADRALTSKIIKVYGY